VGADDPRVPRARRPVPPAPADYGAFATANGTFGAFGAKVTKPGGLLDVVRHALAHDGPAQVDVDVSPDEPPLPGKVEYEQAKKIAQAFLRGQPHKATIATTLFKDKIQQLKS
jgi:pyruvate dehydrogenase (quinone)/pyruvate oxidase